MSLGRFIIDFTFVNFTNIFSVIGGDLQIMVFNLMFFWPCIMNWLYINYQLDALIIIYS